MRSQVAKFLQSGLDSVGLGGGYAKGLHRMGRPVWRVCLMGEIGGWPPCRSSFWGRNPSPVRCVPGSASVMSSTRTDTKTPTDESPSFTSVG
jgi:hypothetical protein